MQSEARTKQNALIDQARVLQCLSTFFDCNEKDMELNMIPFRMLSDYVGMSVSFIYQLLSRLELQGYVSVDWTKRTVQLDPEKWLAQSCNGNRRLRLAFYVSKAPAILRDENSLQPRDPRCPDIPQPEEYTGGSVTEATYFNGVYNTFVSAEMCCPVPKPFPVEYLFVPSLEVSSDKLCSRNLWYLRSLISPYIVPRNLFRRQLRHMYTAAYRGTLAIDLVDSGDYSVMLCARDSIIRSFNASVWGSDGNDFVATDQSSTGEYTRNLKTLTGRSVQLQLDTGLASVEKTHDNVPFKIRGRAAGNVEIIELGAPDENIP